MECWNNGIESSKKHTKLKYSFLYAHHSSTPPLQYRLPLKYEEGTTSGCHKTVYLGFHLIVGK